MSAEAADPIIEVVDTDQEHVLRAGESGEQEGKDGQFHWEMETALLAVPPEYFRFNCGSQAAGYYWTPPCRWLRVWTWKHHGTNGIH
ncbi:hypothetical protein HAHE_17050 [Haloferula helveola]|uniref:Uncharacterized protein n=1 Tax=Haloferula helveola TaxID=490095 RepID=A0ABN6H5B3_9BACT|nr:hypothetical protein HAHE_17050 [Haloferula helveola]